MNIISYTVLKTLLKFIRQLQSTMFIRHVLCSPLHFTLSNIMSVYAEARVISLLNKWSRYRCMSAPVDLTNGIFTAVENERGKDHSVNRHLHLEVETRKLEHFPRMPGSLKKTPFFQHAELCEPASTLKMKLKTQRDRFTRRHKGTHTLEHTCTPFPGLFYRGFNFRV